VVYSVILSGAKNLSFFVFPLPNRREILRSAQNDSNGEYFSAICESCATKNGLFFRRKRQQHIARHSTIARIP
jgi:hypothetical protein